MCSTYLADIEHGPPQIIHMFAEVSSCCVTGIFTLFNQSVHFLDEEGGFMTFYENLSYSSKIIGYYILWGFSALEKNAFICSKRAMLPWVWQPSADSSGRLAHLFYIWTCWVGRERWKPAADSNGRLAWFKFEKSLQNSHYTVLSAEGCHTLYQITQQCCLQRAGGP